MQLASLALKLDVKLCSTGCCALFGILALSNIEAVPDQAPL